MSNRRYELEMPSSLDVPNTAKLLFVSSAKYGGDWHSTAHAHPYSELFYIVSGDGQFRIENNFYSVKANQLVVVNPNVLHTEVSYEAHPMEYIVLGIEGLELAVTRDQTNHYQILDYQRSGEVLTCLRNILRETQGAQPGYEAICQAYMEILILRLMRSASFFISASQPPVSHQCAAIRYYIDTHYKESLTLDDLARESHINKYYLAHVFKEEYGISPINYMLSRRIEESRYLLRETNMSMSQIARVLGFSSASYFSQSFRRAEGISPIEYRKKESNPDAS